MVNAKAVGYGESSLQRSRKILWSLSLILSLMVLGWLLAAYRVPLWCWTGTLLVLFHLSSRGKAAIPLALAWSNGLLVLAAYLYVNPVSVVWKNGKYWALSILAIWLGSLGMTVLVAQIPRIFNEMRLPQLRLWLIKVFILVNSVGFGMLLYQLGVSPQPS